MRATLVRGSNGIFDVAVDGELVFSKHEQGRFPEPDEILDALRHRRPARADQPVFE